MKRSEAFDEYYRVAGYVQAYDGYFVAIKAWGVTVTSGAIAVGFSSHVSSSAVAQTVVFMFALFLACAFWATEVFFKLLQLAHIPRVATLEQALSTTEDDVPGPAYLGSFGNQRAIDRETRKWRRVLFWPHVMLPHAVFGTLSLILAIYAAMRLAL